MQQRKHFERERGVPLRNRMRDGGVFAVLWLSGGFFYCLVELLFRGYTHVSMFVLGGICFLAIGIIRRGLRGVHSVWKMLLSGVAITFFEFLCGIVVNCGLGLRVWDYSSVPMNLMGQVCLPYTLIWCVLSLPAMALDVVYWRYAFGNTEDTFVPVGIHRQGTEAIPEKA